MRSSSLTRALEAMAAMEKGRPYALRPEDAKRRLADELARLCRESAVKPVVIGRAEPGWRRHAEGFKNLFVGVGLDICVEGERTAPRSTEEFPSPADLRKVRVQPLPVPALSDLIALKVMSGRARDDADVVEPLKRHRSRMPALRSAAAKRLKTEEARERLAALVSRAREEAARGR